MIPLYLPQELKAVTISANICLRERQTGGECRAWWRVREESAGRADA
jgi:hypothetical protein